MGRVVTMAYYALTTPDALSIKPNSGLEWFSIHEVPSLSLDHNEIYDFILFRLKKGLLRHPNVFELLPDEFTISDIMTIYEQAFNTKLDASNFQRQVKSSELLKPLNRLRKSDRQNGRPPQLYCLDRNRYRRNSKDPVRFNF